MDLLLAPFRNLLEQIREINEKYKDPQIKMTPFVRFCLISLRIYLLVLVGLMVYKFITMLK